MKLRILTTEERVALTLKFSEKTACRCGTGAQLPPHLCPYAEEIDDDHTTECTCCEACQEQCSWDI